ncbi:PAS domain-containing protein, partial [Desulfovibrio sp.]
MPGPKDSSPAEVPAFAARLLEALPMGLAVRGGEGRVLYANPALRRLLRFSEEEFLGRDFTALGPGAEVVLDPNPPGLALARLKTPDGPRDAFLDVAALPGAADGAARVVLVRGPVERLAEERLRRGQALARVLLDAEDDAALLLDSDGAVVAVNRSGAARFGSTPEEMHGRCLCRYMPWELFEERLARLHDVFCLGRGLRFEDERDGRR